MAELIPTWPFVVMSEENVILENKERDFGNHVGLNCKIDNDHIRSP